MLGACVSSIVNVAVVCETFPQTKEKERTRVTVGGDRLEYDGPVTTDTADMTGVKVMVNGTISAPGARFCCYDISNFYLGTPMEVHECIRMHINITIEEIIEKHKLKGNHGCKWMGAH